VYQLVIPRRVQRAVGSLPSADRHRVVAAIDALATDPRPPGCRKLEIAQAGAFVSAIIALSTKSKTRYA